MRTTHVECTTCSLVCAHCRATDALASCPAEHLIDAVRGFLLRHKRCERPMEPSKQVELFDQMVDRERKLTASAPVPFPEVTLTDERPTARPPAGIDGMSDEPDPETDPPEVGTPDSCDLFNRMYPMASHATSLRADLASVLTDEQMQTLLPVPLQMGTAAFDAIAHWSRCEWARNEAFERARRGEPSIPGLYIPTCRMPPELEALLKPAKKKRGARPLANPGKKRRSGSTASSD